MERHPRHPAPSGIRPALALCLLLCLHAPAPAASPPALTVATWNLENYLVTPLDGRPAKPAHAKSLIAQTLRALHPDVLALQEVGGTNALLELRALLAREGLDYPHWRLANGYDTHIQVALLSRWPISGFQQHSNETFLLRGRRFRTTRGILEADVDGPHDYRFTLFAVHLKSRRESTQAAQDEIREQEALILRRLLDSRLARNPNANLAVVGDFNDLRDSRTLRTILGRGRNAFVDTRPHERNGDSPEPGRSGFVPRTVAWTHFFAREDTYSRVDYILLSPGMAREWDRPRTFVHAFPNWGTASDHRPLIASFFTADR